MCCFPYGATSTFLLLSAAQVALGGAAGRGDGWLSRFVEDFGIFSMGYGFNRPWLIGGLEHEFYDFSYFPYILGMSSSQLTFIFFRGVGIPPTSHDSGEAPWHIDKLVPGDTPGWQAVLVPAVYVQNQTCWYMHNLSSFVSPVLTWQIL